MSQSKRENHPVPQEGGWEIEWPYIDKDMVCVCMAKGKPSCSTRGGWEIEWPYRTKTWCVCVCVRAYVCVCMAKGKTILSHRERGGDGFSFLPGPHTQLENHDTAGGISCSTRGAGRIHHDVHYLFKYKSI